MAILKLVEFLNDFFNAITNCIHIFIDLEKAFDTVNQSIIFLKKMEAYGIRNTLFDLNGSYLEKREQLVKIDQTFSSASQLTRGVPQG